MNKQERKLQKQRRKERQAKLKKTQYFKTHHKPPVAVKSSPVDWSKWPALKAICDKIEEKLYGHGLILDNEVVGGEAIDVLLRCSVEGKRHFSEWQQWDIEDTIAELVRCLNRIPKYLEGKEPPLPNLYLGELLLELKTRWKENDLLSKDACLVVSEAWEEGHRYDRVIAEELWKLGRIIVDTMSKLQASQEEVSTRFHISLDRCELAVLFFRSWISPQAYMDAMPRIRWVQFLDTVDIHLLNSYREWLCFIHRDNEVDDLIEALIEGTKGNREKYKDHHVSERWKRIEEHAKTLPMSD
jgi:hypothetical protein